MKMKRGITNVAAGLVLTAMLLLTYLDSSANATNKSTSEKKYGCKTVGCSAQHRTIEESRKNAGQTDGSAVRTEQPTWTRESGTLRGEAVLMQ